MCEQRVGRKSQSNASIFIKSVQTQIERETLRVNQTETIENMELSNLKIEKGRWLLFWSNNLKTASLQQAVHGIIISVILLILMYFFQDVLLHPDFCDDILYCIYWNQDFVHGVVNGITILFFSIVLLYKTYNNDTDGVFVIIKIGCIIFAVVDIVYYVISLTVIANVIFEQTSWNWSQIVFMGTMIRTTAMIILSSTMVTFAIIFRNSLIITCFYFFWLLLILPSSGAWQIVSIYKVGFHYQNFLLWINSVWWIFYRVMFFVLQVNVLFHTDTGTVNQRNQNLIA